MDSHYKTDSKERLRDILRDDLHRTNFRANFGNEYRRLREFMIPDEEQDRLKTMNRFQRFFATSYLLARSLLLKLSPFRRLLLVIGIIFMFIQVNSEGETTTLSGITILLLLFILMLELKDKIIAADELESGHTIQKALMPPEEPVIPGYETFLVTISANEVCGDFIDYMCSGDGKHYLVLGDVSGKGLPAALLSVKLQATIRALLPETPDVGELVKKVNSIFTRHTPKHIFATMAFLEVEENTGTLKLVNAGHNLPLLCNRFGVKTTKKGCMGIGISQLAEYSSTTYELERGDIFFIYSDGISEARIQSGEMFGVERIMNTLGSSYQLSPRKIADTILLNLNRFLGDEPFKDDISIIVLKRK